MPSSHAARNIKQQATTSRSSSLKRKRASENDGDEPTSPSIPLRNRNAGAGEVTTIVGVKTNARSNGVSRKVSAHATVSEPEKGNKTVTRKSLVVTKVEEAEPADGEADKDTSLLSEEEVSSKKKSERKHKTKEEKEAEAMPLAARTVGLRMFVGAHVSMAKGIENSITNCQHIGGNAFALFLKSQRTWSYTPLKDENRDAFRKACTEHKYDAFSHVLPHGSYLVNLAVEDNERAKQAYDAFLDDLRRCEALGIRYYNFHPGAATSSPLPEAIARLSAQLNRALSETTTVVPVLENMAGSGSVIGSRFSDLRDVISHIKPEFKSRIGVCLDTCHSFAAGYDLRTPDSFNQVLQDFDNTVGLQYLKAFHLNDSKAPFNSKRDLHQNIGLGFLGLRAFHSLMNDRRLESMPLILETPCDRPDPSDPKGKKMIEDKSIWAREIKLLESLIGMDAEGAEFKKLEKELSDKGKAERVKMQRQFEEKVAKDRKKVEKERGKGQKSLVDMMGAGAGAKGKAKSKKEQSPVDSHGDEEEEQD